MAEGAKPPAAGAKPSSGKVADSAAQANKPPVKNKPPSTKEEKGEAPPKGAPPKGGAAPVEAVKPTLPRAFASTQAIDAEDEEGDVPLEKRTAKYDNGKYIGQFKKGTNIRHGTGKFTFLSGSEYDGEWQDGRFHGEGKFRYETGDRYVGSFKFGEKHGHGKYFYKGNNSYDGQFKFGVKDGEGTFTWNNGESYTGIWKQGEVADDKVDENMLHEIEMEKRKRRYEYCLVFPFTEETKPKKKCCGLIKSKTSRIVEQRKRLFYRLRKAGIVYKKTLSADHDDVFVRITAPMLRLEKEAEAIGLKCRLKENFGGRYQFYSRANKRKFEMSPDDPNSPFSTAQRSMLLQSIVESEAPGANIDLNKEIKEGTIKHAYALHYEPERHILFRKWVLKVLPFNLPLDMIKNYFGEKLAFYYAWLSFYQMMLIGPALLGFACFATIVGYSIAEGGIDADIPITPVYAILVALWTTVFLEFWKRRQMTLAARWDVLDFESRERIRPEYKGKKKPNPITFEDEPYEAGPIRFARLMVSLSTLAVLAIIVLGSMVGFVFLRAIDNTTGFSLGMGVANGVVIVILNKVARFVATKLNNFENRRTDTQYEDSLIAKLFLFQFFSSYFTLFYVAYVSTSGDRVDNLARQLATIFVTQLTIGQVKDILIPVIVRKIKTCKESCENKRALKKSGKLPYKMPRYQYEAQLAAHDINAGVDDYAEVIIQYGYVTLFAVAFPLASTLAFINNMLELKFDAERLVVESKRPEAKGAQDIGTWYSILNILSIMAVLTNTTIMGISSNQLDEWPWFKDQSDATHVWIIVGVEHAIFLFKFALQWLIPDTPSSVATKLAQRKYRLELNMKVELGIEPNQTLADWHSSDADDMSESAPETSSEAEKAKAAREEEGNRSGKSKKETLESETDSDSD